MRLSGVATVCIVGALSLSSSAFVVGEAPTQIRAKARILGADGRPIGGSFGLVGQQTRRVLQCGSVDNLGELDVSVEVPIGEKRVILLLDSGGMLRNAPDERRMLGRRAETMVLRDEEWWSPRWVGFKVPSAIELACSGESSCERVVADESGREFRDLVKVSADVTGKPEVDFGEIRFRTAHSWMEVSVDLVDSAGKPDATPVVLAGFTGVSEHLGWNMVYPHMALAQRGSKLRVLLTRAGWRLLLGNPDGTIRIAPRADGGGRITTLRWPEDVRDRIQSRAQSVSVKQVLRPDEIQPPEVKCPEEPAYWWLGEPSFR